MCIRDRGLCRSGQSERIGELTQDVICITSKGRPVKPKTIGQKQYVDAILKDTVTIGVGPAGTGKTYLAVAAAVAAFRDKQVNRIILTRPAVEAGERLGFLPGDLQSKVDPYPVSYTHLQQGHDLGDAGWLHSLVLIFGVQHLPRFLLHQQRRLRLHRQLHTPGPSRPQHQQHQQEHCAPEDVYKRQVLGGGVIED